MIACPVTTIIILALVWAYSEIASPLSLFSFLALHRHAATSTQLALLLPHCRSGTTSTRTVCLQVLHGLLPMPTNPKPMYTIVIGKHTTCFAIFETEHDNLLNQWRCESLHLPVQCLYYYLFLKRTSRRSAIILKNQKSPMGQSTYVGEVRKNLTKAKGLNGVKKKA